MPIEKDYQKELGAKLGINCSKLERFIPIKGNCAEIDSLMNENIIYKKICEYCEKVSVHCGFYVIKCSHPKLFAEIF